MKRDWFRTLIALSVLVLSINIILLMTAQADFPLAEVDLSPYTGTTSIDATIFNLRGDNLIERPITLEAAYRERFQAIMNAFIDSDYGRIESLSVLSVHEANGRIYLDLGRNSFSHPFIAPENISRHVQAIVNSLTSHDRRLPVQFLFEGEILDEPIHDLSFKLPFHRNEANLEYHRGHIREMIEDFLTKLGQADYEHVSQMVYIAPVDRMRERTLLQTFRAYHDKKNGATPRQIEVFSDEDGYRIEVYYVGSRPTERWDVRLIDNVHYIIYTGSPLDIE